MIRKGFHIAETDEEKRAVYRLRYDVYVEEMGRYRATADHEQRLLVEPEDETALIFYAAPEGEVVATHRMGWGGHGFSKRQIESDQLEPFLAELAPEVMAVGERGMVVPALRGSPDSGSLRHRARFRIAQGRSVAIGSRGGSSADRLGLDPLQVAVKGCSEPDSPDGLSDSSGSASCHGAFARGDRGFWNGP